MAPWRAQAFRAAAQKLGRPKEVIANAIEATRFQLKKSPNSIPILSLAHLAHLTKIDYAQLRNTIARHDPEPYRQFRIRKRPLPGNPNRFRIITVPSHWLMGLQRWLNANVLKGAMPHEASTAFNEGDSIQAAALLHCGCRWLIKIDIQNFFESVTEAQVYRVYESLGYQPLVAFELARLSTRIGSLATRRFHRRFRSNAARWTKISAYSSGAMGHLPQGAPTSPLLANLAARDLDGALLFVAEKSGLTYTRYADDLTFSTQSTKFSRKAAAAVIAEVYAAIASNGFTPNKAKTVVAPPGSRKVVLGLLVDRDTPRLTREFKSTLRQHLYYLQSSLAGPAAHAAKKGHTTVFGLRNHVLGLIQYARQIEPKYGAARLSEFSQLKW